METKVLLNLLSVGHEDLWDLSFNRKPQYNNMVYGINNVISSVSWNSSRTVFKGSKEFLNKK
ncbi:MULTISPECIES: hypothetical protein [Methanosarcina]|mgnify:CR=1 FL=1|jgi:hypothetical protein|uniref:Uncharacterized protein n=1 Tax=Methanosarcina mazei TaxID=2209 RepID=A0A0F8KJM4_METMZ|nr:MULTISPECIES: hypothetical protein [Methanosarcina]KKG65099.1 hypothetical protein DU45_04825 [Methanosarcina mazei]KKG88218.1 hypothetical protein DU69_04075 [Methanosarcina mazei]